jgi:hypothetical protein
LPVLAAPVGTGACLFGPQGWEIVLTAAKLPVDPSKQL